jgi:hypothetical protein
MLCLCVFKADELRGAALASTMDAVNEESESAKQE